MLSAKLSRTRFHTKTLISSSKHWNRGHVTQKFSDYFKTKQCRVAIITRHSWSPFSLSWSFEYLLKLRCIRQHVSLCVTSNYFRSTKRLRGKLAHLHIRILNLGNCLLCSLAQIAMSTRVFSDAMVKRNHNIHARVSTSGGHIQSSVLKTLAVSSSETLLATYHTTTVSL